MIALRRLGLSFLRNTRSLRVTPISMKSEVVTKQSKISETKLSSSNAIDKLILSSVEKEIHTEKKGLREIVSPPGWEFHIENDYVYLTKKFETELIRVVFQIEDTDKYPYPINEKSLAEDLEVGKVDAEPSEFVCVPDVLTVKVLRQGKGKLNFNLSYIEDEDVDEEDYSFEDDADDKPYDEESPDNKPYKYDDKHALSFQLKNNLCVDLDSVSFYDEFDNFVYDFKNDMFDHEFGCNMIEFLESRGINAKFFNAVMDLSTQLDSKQYLKFLQGLKSFYSP